MDPNSRLPSPVVPVRSVDRILIIIMRLSLTHHHTIVTILYDRIPSSRDHASSRPSQALTEAVCDTSVTAAFIPAGVLQEALELFSKRFLNLFYRMWVVYGSRITEYILHGLYDYNSEELKMKLERGYVLTVLKDRTDK